MHQDISTWIPIREVAKRVSLTPWAVRMHILGGNLEAIQMAGWLWYVNPASVDEFIAAGCKKPISGWKELRKARDRQP